MARNKRAKYTYEELQKAFAGEFMQPEIVEDTWYVGEDKYRVYFAIPSDVMALEQVIEETGADPEDIETVKGFGARIQAPGYMDASDWTVYDTEQEAIDYLMEYYAPEDYDDE